ncbi:MAG: hypothetical protein R2867_31885 [Caldilineaceae bacterium]
MSPRPNRRSIWLPAAQVVTFIYGMSDNRSSRDCTLFCREHRSHP